MAVTPAPAITGHGSMTYGAGFGMVGNRSTVDKRGSPSTFETTLTFEQLQMRTPAMRSFRNGEGVVMDALGEGPFASTCVASETQ